MVITLVGLGVLGTRVLKLLPEDANIQFIDYDFVEEKNVGRQYPLQALGMRKVDAAKQFFRAKSGAYHKHLDWSTIGLLQNSSLVIDCTDNALVRRVINNYCAKESIPWIHSGLSDRVGVVALFLPEGPCFECLYGDKNGETCGPELELSLADKTAHAVVEMLTVFLTNPQPLFKRITQQEEIEFVLTKRERCKTCAGEYSYLEPHDFYITFCNTMNCMSAKPARSLRHDRGVGETHVIDGEQVIVYPNGEVQFLKKLDDDKLYELAEKMYSTIIRKRA